MRGVGERTGMLAGYLYGHTHTSSNTNSTAGTAVSAAATAAAAAVVTQQAASSLSIDELRAQDVRLLQVRYPHFLSVGIHSTAVLCCRGRCV